MTLVMRQWWAATPCCKLTEQLTLDKKLKLDPEANFRDSLKPK